jgi:hypothetical protein
MNAALAKYYTICAAVTVSELPYHAAYLLSSEDTPWSSAFSTEEQPRSVVRID